MKLKISLSALATTTPAQALALDHFLDTHQSNVHGEDLMVFFHELREVVGREVPIINDLSSPPIRFFMHGRTKKILAWFDETDNTGYRPKS